MLSLVEGNCRSEAVRFRSIASKKKINSTRLLTWEKAYQYHIIIDVTRIPLALYTITY